MSAQSGRPEAMGSACAFLLLTRSGSSLRCRDTSGVRGEADSMCSRRAFRVVTRRRHGKLRGPHERGEMRDNRPPIRITFASCDNPATRTRVRPCVTYARSRRATIGWRWRMSARSKANPKALGPPEEVTVGVGQKADPDWKNEQIVDSEDCTDDGHATDKHLIGKYAGTEKSK
jgi:hypothetical protein